MPVTTQVSVRPAVAADGDLILQFIRDLAAYEKLLDDVRATRDDITVALFGDNPKAFCDIAEIDGRPVGFALWFYNFSTFVGRHGIYLEDLFVQPQARGSGAGKALLANLARRCVDENLGRLEWAVLDWNAPSIAFYDSLGAAAMDEWIVRRMTGEALARLAGV
ncbi:GNAT family N-acetyltransferase [Caulobacter rhizosphaerae]|jgi:GNAT superfamily N-acetyltransferase|uniref:GNAT superfamily N-acetyltransferase n=1 Tax=Caulobacter rhizosphaerae TaxID=2010972 RepID=A0ABU1N3E4_9CAUL|nr:GNAT family N-acetyltransferase [Caulobacter rhizosphaerae]MDR6532970.1 GNAT superfamily N-acetyltransferase [Caulobacter rhizosphaerae]GGL34530.1 N-acetyltransferase [Caulobacter rhizosphaerae]